MFEVHHIAYPIYFANSTFKNVFILFCLANNKPEFDQYVNLIFWQHKYYNIKYPITKSKL